MNDSTTNMENKPRKIKTDAPKTSYSTEYIEQSILKKARELKKKNSDLTMQECILAVIAYELDRIGRRVS